MEKEKTIALCGVVLFSLLGVYLLISVSDKSSAGYYDNTSIESRVNVTNVAPAVSKVNLYENDGSDDSINLEEGSTELLVCNATVDDWNGWSDIVSVNATIYDSDNYNSSSPNDNNYHYFNGNCTNSSISGNSTALKFSCSFNVWYYANNATWNCNVTAMDFENATGTAIDTSAPTITMLAALNLSTNLIDFGEMTPGQTSTTDENVNVTNTGNVNINLSVDGFGATDGDGLAMNCSSLGNISVDYLRYNITAGEIFATSMWNLTDTKLSSGIPGLSVVQRVDDDDNAKLNSTNSTYWKLRIPLGTKGFCNGTVTFSAVI